MNIRSLLAVAGLGATLAVAGAAAQTKAAPAPASPAVTGPSKVALINIQEAIVGTEEGKKLNADLQARFAPRRTELDNDQKEITALQNQLSAGGNTMSAQAKQDLSQQIQTKQRDFQQSADNAQSDFQNAQTEMMNTVGSKMMPILKAYAEQHGYTAVLDVSLPWPQNPVLYYNPGVVITAEIIKLYDQAHPVAAGTTSKPGGN